ncbi:DoxX family membrane protein [Neoactinobaculum massilliense]|uniref:DoxX family membrane protein n=1 Tax=Neoactinobaculum massilliense TaxID=2364794 RepID=UPI000F53102E|nr:DoxX family membrane protein [Neoactinobaculum massilliense]
MSLKNFVIRSLVAAPLIAGGIGARSHADRIAPALEGMADKVNDTTGLSVTGKQLALLHADTLALGGATMALGILPRLSALGLLANLIPTTVVGHPFWKHSGAEFQEHLTGFLRNGAYVGGLLAVATGSLTAKKAAK